MPFPVVLCLSHLLAAPSPPLDSQLSLQRASVLSGAERPSVEEGTPQNKTLRRKHVLYSGGLCSGSDVRATWDIFSFSRTGFAQSFPSLCFFPFQPTGSCTCSTQIEAIKPPRGRTLMNRIVCVFALDDGMVNFMCQPHWAKGCPECW